jgi:hypothetical protein
MLILNYPKIPYGICFQPFAHAYTKVPRNSTRNLFSALCPFLYWSIPKFHTKLLSSPLPMLILKYPNIPHGICFQPFAHAYTEVSHNSTRNLFSALCPCLYGSTQKFHTEFVFSLLPMLILKHPKIPHEICFQPFVHAYTELSQNSTRNLFPALCPCLYWSIPKFHTKLLSSPLPILILKHPKIPHGICFQPFAHAYTELSQTSTRNYFPALCSCLYWSIPKFHTELLSSPLPMLILKYPEIPHGICFQPFANAYTKGITLTEN